MFRKSRLWHAAKRSNTWKCFHEGQETLHRIVGISAPAASSIMSSLVLRHLMVPDLGAAAQQTVMCYAERQWTLWLLLVTLPLVVVVTSCATLMQSWVDEHSQTGF